MNDDQLNRPLWIPRSPEETKAMYRDWATDYEADVIGAGYLTPKRIAETLANVADRETLILDFGCGTGLSGAALRDAGFMQFDGTDITPEMLEYAQDKAIYRKLWQSNIGELSFATGTYGAIIAAGVVSLGAAPPETLDDLIAKLVPGGLLAFSYNDPTLADANYMGILDSVVAEKHAEVIARNHGPHLPAKDMGSDVIVLRRL